MVCEERRWRCRHRAGATRPPRRAVGADAGRLRPAWSRRANTSLGSRSVAHHRWHRGVACRWRRRSVSVARGIGATRERRGAGSAHALVARAVADRASGDRAPEVSVRKPRRARDERRATLAAARATSRAARVADGAVCRGVTFRSGHSRFEIADWNRDEPRVAKERVVVGGVRVRRRQQFVAIKNGVCPGVQTQHLRLTP